MWVGYLARGWLGALVTALCFILPSYLLVLTVACLYERYQGLEIVQSLFQGIAPAVMAVIAVAAVKLARLTNGKDVRLQAIAVVAFVVTAVTGAEIALLFIGAGLAIMIWEAPPSFALRWVRSVAMLPVALPTYAAASADTYLALSLFFLKAGALIFGSASRSFHSCARASSKRRIG